DHVALLTPAPFAAFAAGLGCFDEVLIDPRPRPFALGEWWALRRQLRRGRFDRVYDLQTSQRSSSYLRLFARHSRPEWSGIAAGCSHPHANLDRDRQHTIDKQAEQLLMAGIHPTLLPKLPTARGVLFSAESDPALCAPRGEAVQILAVADLNELGVDAVLAAAVAVMPSLPHPVEAAPA